MEGGGRKLEASKTESVSSKERMKTGNTFLKSNLKSDPILLHFLFTARY